ncbi:MAG: heavy-metal-associated domain-containing protein [Oscillochloridaceae bacterium umkhey_bin13]
MIVEILRLEGMRSERDRRVITATLARIPGLGRVVINLADQTVRLERAETTSLTSLISALEGAGYRVSVMA